jgi:hypothetical protein
MRVCTSQRQCVENERLVAPRAQMLVADMVVVGADNDYLGDLP